MSLYDKDRTDDPRPRMKGYPNPGLNAVNEYLVSGRPWMKTLTMTVDASDRLPGAGSELQLIDDSDSQFEFPFVAKRVVVKNNAGMGGTDVIVSLCSLNVLDADDVGETDSAVLVNGNYYLVSAGSELELNVKCRRIYVSEAGAAGQTVSVFAELTGIIHDYNLDVDDIAGVSG